MAIMHIRMKGVLKGQTQFVTLNTTIGQNEISKEAWEEAVLKSNPEVMGFHSKKYIDFVSEAEYARLAQETERASAEDALDPESTTLEQALAVDNPGANEMRRHLEAAKSSLAKLEAILSGASPAAKPTTKAEAVPAQPEDDGLDLPMSAPKGLKPQAATEQYLKKTATEKRKFLKECRDIGMLRDAAMFEPDPKMKSAARKAAKLAERVAVEAAGMAAVS